MRSRIDPATGRNRRDKSPIRTAQTGTRGAGAPRGNGQVVDRAAWRREQRVASAAGRVARRARG